MKKVQIISVIGIVIGCVIIVEILRLVLLYRDVAGFKEYWKERSRQPGEFVYIALGDSAAQGIGASQPQNGYVGLIAKAITERTGKTVRVVNVSVSGAVVKDVIQKQLPKIKGIKPDLVTIEIGANDVAKYNKEQFTADFTQLTKLLPADTYVSNMPYFATRPMRRPAAFAISKIISENVAIRSDLKLVDLQTITQERDSWLNYAADLFHPNDRAYRNWAEAFLNVINENLDG